MEKEIYKPGSMGRKIERIRRMKGINQETMANLLGITRQSFSKLEQAEDIDDEKLEQIAKGLGVTSDSIKQFNEDAIFNNNIFDQNNTVINNNFNPIDKIVELYERLLKSEREKIEILKEKHGLK